MSFWLLNKADDLHGIQKVELLQLHLSLKSALKFQSMIRLFHGQFGVCQTNHNCSNETLSSIESAQHILCPGFLSRPFRFFDCNCSSTIHSKAFWNNGFFAISRHPSSHHTRQLIVLFWFILGVMYFRQRFDRLSDSHFVWRLPYRFGRGIISLPGLGSLVSTSALSLCQFFSLHDTFGRFSSDNQVGMPDRTCHHYSFLFLPQLCRQLEQSTTPHCILVKTVNKWPDSGCS